ncbi:uncharacterized protein TNCV_4377211 [Trichonephila clavipes]|nr:uncharacterized protein TNCV_4377211 [Trichonephila clavipes]
MVSDGTEFAVGDIKKWFDEARQNTKAKHEKWEKYYDLRRRDVQIKRVLEVKQNNLVAWRSGEEITVDVDQVRLYHHRKSDDMEKITSSSDSNSLRYKSNNFEGMQPRSNESQYCRKNGSGESREWREAHGNGQKKFRTEETMMPSNSGYYLRPRGGAKVESRPANEKRTKQGGPDRFRRSRETTVQTLRRGAKKVKQQEYQKQKRSATALPGEDRRSEQSKIPVP